MRLWPKRWTFKAKAEQPRGTFVMQTEWVRSEELRPDRLGPAEDDVEDPERVRIERWRPSRSLGPMKRS
jgi:hypothetical protein